MIWLFIVRISSLAVRNFQEANTDTRTNSFQMWGKLAIQELYHGFTTGLTNSRSVTIIINSHFMAISCLSLCLLTAKLIQSTRDNVKGCRWFSRMIKSNYIIRLSQPWQLLISTDNYVYFLSPLVNSVLNDIFGAHQRSSWALHYS